MTSMKASRRLRPSVLGGLFAGLALLHVGSASAQDVGSRSPYQKYLSTIDCDTDFVCDLHFPPVPAQRRREITLASCHFKTTSDAQLESFDLSVLLSPNRIIHLIPVLIGFGNARTFQSNDQVFMRLGEGDSATITVVLQGASGGSISSLACGLSGETIVTN